VNFDPIKTKPLSVINFYGTPNLDTLHMVMLLGPYEGDCYNDPIDEDVWSLGIENNYKFMGCREEYINPTVDGELSWRSVKSYDTNYEDSLDRW
jgi:hypothetical protein